MPKPIGTRRRRNRESILSFVVDAKAPIAPHWLDEMPMLVARHRERIAQESCCVCATVPIDCTHGTEAIETGEGPTPRDAGSVERNADARIAGETDRLEQRDIEPLPGWRRHADGNGRAMGESARPENHPLTGAKR